MRKTVDPWLIPTPAGWKPRGETARDWRLIPYNGKNLRKVVKSWGIEPSDSQAMEAVCQLENRWRGWSLRRRQLLMDCALAVERAEAAKSRWHSKRQRGKHRKVAEVALKAAALARELVELETPRVLGGRGLRRLAHQLFHYVHDAKAVTAESPEERNAVLAAAKHLRELREASAGRPLWDLVASVAWLASGTRFPVDERTVRRYLESKPVRILAGTVWSRGRRTVSEAEAVVEPPASSGRFCSDLRMYLKYKD